MNWDYYESVLRFQRILDAQGISEALKECGAKEGDLVMIGKAKSTEDRQAELPILFVKWTRLQ